MNAMTDSELLRAYVEQHSEQAFAELVNRHVGLVYASAQRQLQQADHSADVTQAVFLLLARKAPTLHREVVLPGWLFQSTRFLASRAKRGELRRQYREKEAAMVHLQPDHNSSESNLWNELSPHLDDAIASLSESERQAVLLRFFEGKTMRDLGEKLGVSEEAAKKRVSRALDKLRSFLAKHGVVLSGAALGSMLLESPTQAYPAQLPQNICAAVKGGSAATSITIAALVAGGIRDWLWASVRQFAPWAVGTVALVAGVSIMLSTNSKPNETVAAVNQDVETSPPATGATLLVTQPWTRANTPAATDTTSKAHFYLSVLDRENSQPIAGARALAQIWGLTGGVDKSTELTTDANGSLVVTVPDKPFRILRVWLSAAGYIPLSMDWRTHEFNEAPVFHTSRLTRGAVLKVNVVDDQGEPVAGARIEIGGPGINTAQRENISYHPRLSGGRTDQSGHYQCDQILPDFEAGRGGVTFAISHPDFAIEKFSIHNPAQLATNQVIALERGVRLAGTILGPYNEPVQKARLEERYAQFGLETKTDSTGHFEFPHVKPGTYTLEINAPGYSELVKGVLIDTNAAEMILHLAEERTGTPSKRKSTHLVGTVVDAESNEPAPRFRVILNAHRGTDNQLLGEGANGTFDWQTELMFIREFSLIVEAEGYEPVESDVRPIGAAEQEFRFQLKRGSDLTGWVLQPDGQPATNAALGLSATGRYGLNLTDDGKLANYGHNVNQTTTDEHGHFRLQKMVGAERLQVAHESGCASVAISETTNTVIQLKRWGAVEGILYVGSTPASNQPVNLGFGFVSENQYRIPFDYNTRTDAKGQFRFAHVQPGIHRVQRLMKFHKRETGQIGFSHAKSVTVEPGVTTHVVLGGDGVPVIGKLKLEPALDEYDWSLDLHALVEQRPNLPPVKWEDFGGDDIAYSRAWNQREFQITKYYLAIAPDGAFLVDDVLPGNYDLNVTIKSMPEDPLNTDSWMTPRKPIGNVKLTVTVPESATKEPLDLGIITVPVTNSLPDTQAR